VQRLLEPRGDAGVESRVFAYLGVVLVLYKIKAKRPKGGGREWTIRMRRGGGKVKKLNAESEKQDR